MSKTVADHARAYRTRRANKIARYEAALREIRAMAEIRSGTTSEFNAGVATAWQIADAIAAAALATPTAQS